MSGIILLSMLLCAEIESTEQSLEEYMEKVQQDYYPSLSSLTEYPFGTEEALDVLNKYFFHESDEVRRAAVLLLQDTAIKTNSTTLRSAAINRLIDLLNEDDSTLFRSALLALAHEFGPSDFTSHNSRTLTRILLTWSEGTHEVDIPVRHFTLPVLKIIAKARLEGALPIVSAFERFDRNENRVSSKTPREIVNSLTFACICVRAQLGDLQSMERIQQIYSALNDDLERLEACDRLRMVYDKRAIELMSPLLYSEKTVLELRGGRHGDVADHKIATRISLIFADMLRDYPPPRDLDKCRQRMNQRSEQDLEFK